MSPHFILSPVVEKILYALYFSQRKVQVEEKKEEQGVPTRSTMLAVPFKSWVVEFQ